MNMSKLVFKNITRRKGRFLFTLLGITLGIASFVALISLGIGLKSEIKKQASDLGANLIVTPKGWCAYEQVSVLTGEQLPEVIPFEDVKKIASIKGLTAIPYLTEKTAINNSPVPVYGILPEEMKSFKGWELKSGDYLLAEDENFITIGFSIAKQFNLNINDEVTIRGKKFKVKGILKETGSKDDIAIFMPLSVAKRLYDVGDKVSIIAVKVDDISKIDEYILKIQDVANVSVVSDKQLLKSVLSIVGTVNITLQLIATVAIMASSFGIINTMMTAIYERKREIGILQAIGANQSTIFKIFIMESGLYGLLGGILGVILGFIFSTLAFPYISKNEFTIFLKGTKIIETIDIKIIVGSILFSFFISILSGFYPAWRASKLNPVEAISYE